MKTYSSIVAGLLMGVTAATPIVAQPLLAPGGQVCLQHNRMQSWHVLNDRQVDFTDLDRHHYIITMTPACLGITDPQAHLIFHTWQNLQCLPIGEIIEVTTPVFGRTQCAVDSVQLNGPQLPGYGTSG